jgi:hypothetical protein
VSECVWLLLLLHSQHTRRKLFSFAALRHSRARQGTGGTAVRLTNKKTNCFDDERLPASRGARTHELSLFSLASPPLSQSLHTLHPKLQLEINNTHTPTSTASAFFLFFFPSILEGSTWLDLASSSSSSWYQRIDHHHLSVLSQLPVISTSYSTVRRT